MNRKKRKKAKMLRRKIQKVLDTIEWSPSILRREPNELEKRILAALHQSLPEEYIERERIILINKSQV